MTVFTWALSVEKVMDQKAQGFFSFLMIKTATEQPTLPRKIQPLLLREQLSEGQEQPVATDTCNPAVFEMFSDSHPALMQVFPPQT